MSGQQNQRVSILHNKYFLYATEFFSGMSVMAIELGASRLLAPPRTFPSLGALFFFCIFAPP